jgi:cell division topological specificity factor
MRLFDLFRRRRDTETGSAGSAAQARERLRIVLAHERADRSKLELLPILQREILEVLTRHLDISSDQVNVAIRKDGAVSKIEVQVEFPEATPGTSGNKLAAMGVA